MNFINVVFLFKRGAPPAEAPFVVEDMPQMHRFVFDFYSHYVQSLRAQQEVSLTVGLKPIEIINLNKLDAVFLF